ncbi:MAG: type II toxin-antitoxin system VapC family toxin [Thiohalomonadales bacterium]
MNLLLDTHIIIWALENNPALPNEARNVIIDGSNLVFVSSASVWEISIKRSIGKLEVPDNIVDELSSHRFSVLNINAEHALLAGELPLIHKDPFDRMLIAQAKIEKLTFISTDPIMKQYNVKLLKGL